MADVDLRETVLLLVSLLGHDVVLLHTKFIVS